jgi:hypothetical protein
MLKAGRTLVPSAKDAKVTWAYTTEQPGRGWAAADFDDSGWKRGVGGFGTRQTPGAVIGTVWNTPSIWLRRTIDWPADAAGEVRLDLHHDEDAVIYLNGEPAARMPRFSSNYVLTPIRPEARAVLKPGRNVLAIECRQTQGGQYIDAGIVEVVPVTASAP